MLTDIEVLNALNSVLQTSREGSFRGAMRASGRGFRTLQNTIKALEEELGVVIFRRTADGVFPTPDGNLIIQKAREVEAIVSETRRIGKALQQDEEGEVAIAVTEGLGTFWILPRLGEFNEKNRGISLRLHPSMSIADLRRYEIDLAIQVVEPIQPEIKRVRIGTLHLMLTASASYIEKNGEPKTMEELAEHTFIFHTSPQSSDRLRIEEMIGRRMLQSQSIVMRNSSAHLVTIEHGMGIGFIPSYTFALGINLVPINLPISYPIDIWLCFHPDSRNVSRVAKAIDWLTALFDPRLYPWFRREFVHPKQFQGILDKNGAKELIQRAMLRRS
jgi:DNA-binding transcriptional LysR family regulator